MRPETPPIGLALASAARTVSRAFDDALEQAGGSLPIWLVLLNLKIKPDGSQRELAAAVGVREATLTHHLNAMERAGMLSRQRDPDNRRVHVVELSDAGEAMFLALREVALGFDKRLRRGISADQTRALADVLGRVAANVDGADGKRAPWAGLRRQQDRGSTRVTDPDPADTGSRCGGGGGRASPKRNCPPRTIPSRKRRLTSTLGF